MSKYLIKPISNIYLHPSKVYDLKRDLLLFDKVGMLNVDILLQGLHVNKGNKVIQNTINELDFLIRKGMFIELKDLMQGMTSASLDDDDRALADFTMKLLKMQSQTNDRETRDKLYWQHDELNTRLWCRIANSYNESVYTVPAFSNFSTFEMKNTTKETAYKIVHKLLPLPSDDTPWEKIFDFKNDEESQLKLFALRNWINELPQDIRKDELEDRIKYILSQYNQSLKRHKISSKVTTIRTIVTTIPKAFSELIRLKFHDAIGAFFSLAEQEVNFEKYKQISELSGKELAYISHVNESINKKK